MRVRGVEGVWPDALHGGPAKSYDLEALRFGFLWVPLYFNGKRLSYRMREKALSVKALMEERGRPV